MAAIVVMANRPVVSLVHDAEPGWRWLADRITGVDWRFHDIAPPSRGDRKEKLVRLVQSLRAVHAARHSDMILSFGPGNAAAIELARRLARVSVPHVNYFFNYTPLPPIDAGRRRGRLLRDIGLIVVSADSERAQYARHFGIDPARFETILWGVGMPAVDGSYPVPAGPYVCSIGGNNRDYPTLLAAAALMPDTRFLIVARPVNMIGLAVPANVEVRTNIPFEAAMAVIAGADAIVLPMADSAVAAGHVTIVNAFLLETPVVATRSPGIADYVRDGETGILAPEHDAQAMADALGALLRDPERRARIAAAARAFALERCSERNYIEHLPEVAERLRSARG